MDPFYNWNVARNGNVSMLLRHAYPSTGIHEQEGCLAEEAGAEGVQIRAAHLSTPDRV